MRLLPLLLLTCLCHTPVLAMQVQEMTLLSPVTGEQFTAVGVPIEQPGVIGKADLGADDDGCRHTSGPSEYEYYVITDPFSLFTAMSIEWDSKSGRFRNPLPDEVKAWVRQDLNSPFVIARERAFKSAQAIARSQGAPPPSRDGFAMPQNALGIDERYEYALSCYTKRGALPSVMAKLALTAAWGMRVRLNVPLGDPRLDGGYEEVNRITARSVKEGEDFALAKWLAVYKDIVDSEGLTHEGYYVATATYFGLVLRQGDLAEAERVLTLMQDRFFKIDSDDRGEFLRGLQRERKLSLGKYKGFTERAATLFMVAIAGEEFTRARLPQYMLAVAESLRRSGNLMRAMDWYLALSRLPESQPRLRDDIRTQGKTPGAEAPLPVHLGWLADQQILALRANGLVHSGEFGNIDKQLLSAIVFDQFGTSAFSLPEWQPRSDGDQADCQRMLTMIGQSLLDWNFRLGGWPAKIGELWDRELLKDRNRVNRFHCPVTGEPFVYSVPTGTDLQALGLRTVLLTTPKPLKTADGERWGAYLSGNTVVWSPTQLRPGDQAPK
jgi:hypothetical protein